MTKAKPVAYPNIVDAMNQVVDAHAAIHDTVATHAAEHHAKLEARRKQLHVEHVAKKLIEEDGKR